MSGRSCSGRPRRREGPRRPVASRTNGMIVAGVGAGTIRA